MAQRYVRVQAADGQIYYGLLQLSRAVHVLDAPPWLNGQLNGSRAGGRELLYPGTLCSIKSGGSG